MTKLQTQVGLSADTVAGYAEVVRSLAGETAKAPQELAKGLLAITSAGEEGAEALVILESAAKLSAIGLGETEVVARALTSATVAFADSGLTAAEAADQLLAIVQVGAAEADQLAGALGRVVGIASQVGISFAEVGGFIATFTRLGVSAEEATTALRSVLATLISPTEAAAEALAEVGLSTEELRQMILERGLAQGLIDLLALFEGNTEALTKVIPNIRALSGVLGTAGAQGEDFAAAEREIAEATGLVDEAMSIVAETTEFKVNQAMVDLKVVLSDIGATVLPALATAAEFLSTVLGALTRDTEHLTLAMLEMRRQLLEITLSVMGFVDTVQDWAAALITVPGPIGIAAAALNVLETQGLDADRAIEGLQSQLDAINTEIAERELMEWAASIHSAREEVQLLVLANNALLAQQAAFRVPTTVAQSMALLRQVERDLMRGSVVDALVPPPAEFVAAGEEAGEAIGGAMADAIQQSILDMPAVTPEALIDILHDLQTLDFMTVGDQLRFVQAMADNAARTLEETARAAREMWESLAVGGTAFTASLAILAEQAGITVRALEIRLGLVDDFTDLSNAINIVAGAMGTTEAEVLALLSSLSRLAVEEEEVAEASEQVSLSLRDQLSLIGDTISAVSDLAGVSHDELLAVLDDLGIIQIPTLEDAIHALAKELRLSEKEAIELANALADLETTAENLMPSIDSLASDLASFFGVAQDQLEELLGAFPELADAFDRLREQQLAEMAQALFELGLSLFQILDLFDQLGGLTSPATAALEAEIEGVQRMMHAIFREIQRGVEPGLFEALWAEWRRLQQQLADLQAQLDALQGGGGGAPLLSEFQGGQVPAILQTGGRVLPALSAGTPAASIVQHITVNVEDRSPAAIAHAVERAGLELGEQLVAEGV